MSKDKVVLEVGVDLLPDFRDAIDAHINEKISALLENYPDLDLSRGTEYTFDNTTVDGVKTELGRIIRLEKLAEKLYKVCEKLNPPDEEYQG